MEIRIEFCKLNLSNRSKDIDVEIISQVVPDGVEDVPLEAHLVQVHRSFGPKVVQVVLDDLGVLINTLIERSFVKLVGETTQWCTCESHDMRKAPGTREQGPPDKRVKTVQTPVQMPKI